jgi:drug/metabolite transporter (DMT)-like permease
VVFTAIIFYFLYGQKLTLWDFGGVLFIIVCVALIAVGGAGGGGHGKDVSKGLTAQEKSVNLILAIVMAVVTGLVFALNSLSLKYCSDIGCGEA